MNIEKILEVAFILVIIAGMIAAVIAATVLGILFLLDGNLGGIALIAIATELTFFIIESWDMIE